MKKYESRVANPLVNEIHSRTSELQTSWKMSVRNSEMSVTLKHIIMMSIIF